MIPLDTAEEMLSSCDKFLVHYQWLHKKAAQSHDLRYNIVGKFHFFLA